MREASTLFTFHSRYSFAILRSGVIDSNIVSFLLPWNGSRGISIDDDDDDENDDEDAYTSAFVYSNQTIHNIKQVRPATIRPWIPIQRAERGIRTRLCTFYICRDSIENQRRQLSTEQRRSSDYQVAKVVVPLEETEIAEDRTVDGLAVSHRKGCTIPPTAPYRCTTHNRDIRIRAISHPQIIRDNDFSLRVTNYLSFRTRCYSFLFNLICIHKVYI